MCTGKPILPLLALMCGLSLSFFASPARAEDAPAAATATQAQTADQLATTFLAVMISALETGKKEALIALSDESMKTVLKDIDFAALNTKYEPRMKKGYQTTWLGKLRKNDSDVNLWKLSFSDSGNDALLQMSIKAGKINGMGLD